MIRRKSQTWGALAFDIEGTISDEDFARYFSDRMSPSDALGSIACTMRDKFDKLEKIRVVGDLCSMNHISKDQYALELTCEDGAERLKVLASAMLVGRKPIRKEQKVSVLGHWSVQRERGMAVLVAEELDATDEWTDLQRKLYEEKDAIREYSRDGNLRKSYPIQDKMADWQKIALLTNESKTAEDFTRLLERKHAEIVCKTFLAKFTENELALRLQELTEGERFDAICIIKGPPKDDFSFLALNSSRLFRLINESKTPILVGVGRDEDHPIGLENADYVASTYSALAVQIANWANLKRYEKSQGSLFGGFIRKVLRVLLPWS